MTAPNELEECVPTLVVDTCVIVDMFLSSRPRHEIASRLLIEIRNSNSVVRIPAFAMFEISHAIKQEKRLNNGQIISTDHINAGEENGLRLDLVPVDEKFAQKFLDLELPEIRAGDLVFAALAKGEGLPVVTEDQRFKQDAKSAGIQVFAIRQYLEHAFGVQV